MTYRQFRDKYRALFLLNPWEAFKLFRKWWPHVGGMSPNLDTRAALAVYESEPAIRLLQEQAPTFMRKP